MFVSGKFMYLLLLKTPIYYEFGISGLIDSSLHAISCTKDQTELIFKHKLTTIEACANHGNHATQRMKKEHQSKVSIFILNSFNLLL